MHWDSGASWLLISSFRRGRGRINDGIEFTPFLFGWRQSGVYLGIGCRKPAMLYTSGWSALFGPTVSDLLYFM